MKLATIRDDSRDGRLALVHQGILVEAGDIAPTLQAALDDWERCEPLLRARHEGLVKGEVMGLPLDASQLHSPLPRAYGWIDGSAYLNHVRLVRKARNADPPATLETDPLVYQGTSCSNLAPTEDIPHGGESWGVDFEAEVVVILGDTPQGTTAAEAHRYIRLVTICNDVSLRGLIPTELKKGFGFVISKPPTAFAPFAVTPDELGDAWKDGRVHLAMHVDLNGERVGWTEAGPEMHFSFHDLIAHLCQTRPLAAGTILGSGTVSNEDQAHGIACLAEKRMIEIIETGAASTPFLKPGDHVRIDMPARDGSDIFGVIEQTVRAL